MNFPAKSFHFAKMPQTAMQAEAMRMVQVFKNLLGNRGLEVIRLLAKHKKIVVPSLAVIIYFATEKKKSKEVSENKAQGDEN
jgi:hypothetical protein